jgi:hypothetical protein
MWRMGPQRDERSKVFSIPWLWKHASLGSTPLSTLRSSKSPARNGHLCSKSTVCRHGRWMEASGSRRRDFLGIRVRLQNDQVSRVKVSTAAPSNALNQPSFIFILLPVCLYKLHSLLASIQSTMRAVFTFGLALLGLSKTVVNAAAVHVERMEMAQLEARDFIEERQSPATCPSSGGNTPTSRHCWAPGFSQSRTTFNLSQKS